MLMVFGQTVNELCVSASCQRKFYIEIEFDDPCCQKIKPSDILWTQ